MSFSIRFAGPEDAHDVLALIRALAEYEREPDAVEVDAATLAAQLSEASPPFECLLAQRGSETVGLALFFHTYSTWRGKRGIHLEDLFVVPAARGAGIGEALLREVARIALARGCARLEWSVLDWNEPALGFYRALGARALSEWVLHRVDGAALASLAR